jgi:hypothetical protein
MPIETITPKEKQGRLFYDAISRSLDPNNKLYKLRELIDWEGLEAKALGAIEIKQYGRNKKCSRVMLGLLMLQAMYNTPVSYFKLEEIQWKA